jgi:hypothetical protein
VTPVDAGVGVGLIQPSCIAEEAVESPTSGAGGNIGARICSASMLKIEDTDLGVSGAAHDGSVIGVGHELDGEDVGMMPSAHARVQSKGSRKVGRVILPDVEIGIVGTRGEQVATGRPTAIVSRRLRPRACGRPT